MKQEKIISFFYLRIFIIIVILLVILSLFIKGGVEFLGSTFKYNSFSLLYLSKESKIIYVDKAENRVVFFAIGDMSKILRGKDPFEAAIALSVPINAILIDKSNDSPINIKDFLSSESRFLFGDDKIVFKNLDHYDIYKLMNAIRRAPSDSRKEIRVNLLNENDIKNKVADSFRDSAISALSYTVEIDNGTSINGLGNDAASIFTKSGYNVIAVRTVGKDLNSFVAYNNEPNFFTNSIIALAQFKFLRKKVSQSADVTIYLGNDLEANLTP